MPTLKVQHTFQGFGGDARDQFSNTFYVWHASTTGEAGGEFVANTISGFYTHSNTESSITDFMAPVASGPGAMVKVYDMANPPESSPVYQSVDITEAWSHSGERNLPEEVAVCLSYSALHSGFNRPRRRGRIYLGPFSVIAMDPSSPVTQRPRVSPDLINAAMDAATWLKTQLLTQGWHWRVFSQMDGNGFDIVEVSVDDAFDTIRGRGSAPFARFANTI